VTLSSCRQIGWVSLQFQRFGRERQAIAKVMFRGSFG
jgi:hypothetical protein